MAPTRNVEEEAGSDAIVSDNAVPPSGSDAEEAHPETSLLKEQLQPVHMSIRQSSTIPLLTSPSGDSFDKSSITNESVTLIAIIGRQEKPDPRKSSNK
jgi:hypothetical protein